MISESVVHAVVAVVYTVATVGCLWALQRVDETRQQYLRLSTLTIAVGAVTSVSLVFGVGSLTINGYEVALPSVVNNLVAYPVLWVITAMLADVDDRLIAAAALAPFVQVVAFWLSPIYGGVVAIGSLVVVVGSHLLLAVLFLGRIWDASSSVPEERRLLHWKARNLLLFLIGMFIVFSFLSVAGVFSAFGMLVLNQYVSVLIRVGFAGFLFANVGALGDATTAGRDVTAADD